VFFMALYAVFAGIWTYLSVQVQSDVKLNLKCDAQRDALCLRKSRFLRHDRRT